MQESHDFSWRLTARIATLALPLLALPMTAPAAIVSGSLAFTATGFAPAGAPMDPVTGTVAFSFDNSATFFNAADGATVYGAVGDVSVSGLNLPGSWTPVLSYIKDNPGVVDALAIGNGPTTVITAGTDDWRSAANAISTSPGFRELWYAQASIADVVDKTNAGSVTPVPEPGIWEVMLAGLAVRSRRLRKLRADVRFWRRLAFLPARSAATVAALRIATQSLRPRPEIHMKRESEGG